MMILPFCYDGCPFSIVKENNGTVMKNGVPCCKKFPNGMSFPLEKVNAECPVAQDPFKKHT